MKQGTGYILAGIVGMAICAGLFWNYTDAIKEKNAVERERIASDERVKTAQMEQEKLLDEKDRESALTKATEEAEEKRASEAKADAQKKEAANQAALAAGHQEYLAAQKQQSLDSCLAIADANYTSNWNRSCVSLADAQDVKRGNCLATADSSIPDPIKFCWNVWPTLKRELCRLPASSSDRWDKVEVDEKAECYLRFK